MTGYVPLSMTDLAIAALLVAINGALSVALGLRFEGRLAFAVARMAAQLVLAALVLKFIFEQTSPAWSLAVLTVIAAVATAEVARQPERRFAGLVPLLSTSFTAFASGLLATAVALLIVRPSLWYAPRFLLPLLGMIAGNALAGAALVIDSITYAACRERNAIETRLALGEPRLVAMGPLLRRGLRAGLMPIIVMLSTVGIVTLPGMMTGQVLAGVDPVEAAKYQILLLLLIAGAGITAAVAAGFATLHFLSDDRARLRLDRLAREPRPRASPRFTKSVADWLKSRRRL